MIISVEGADGTGKSSVAGYIKDRLQEMGREVLLVREPGSTGLGERIRLLLLRDESINICPKAELFLYLSARAQLVEELILPALKAGKIVVMDRYVDSTLVYQGAVMGLGVDKVLRVLVEFFGSVFPTFTVVLDSDVEDILARLEAREKDKVESRGVHFLEKVIQAYRDLVEVFPERMLLVDSRRPLEEVCEEVWQEVKKRL